MAVNTSLVAANIRGKRAEKNISQDELADLCGVSTTTVCNWENERALPTLENICELADVFETTTDLLTGREQRR